jgi:hypothetical protein
MIKRREDRAWEGQGGDKGWEIRNRASSGGSSDGQSECRQAGGRGRAGSTSYLRSGESSRLLICSLKLRLCINILMWICSNPRTQVDRKDKIRDDCKYVEREMCPSKTQLYGVVV